MKKHILPNLWAMLAPVFLGILFLTLTRITYFLWHFDRVVATGEPAFVFIQGIRFDIVLISLIYVIPISLSPLFFTHRKLFGVWRGFMLIYTTVWFAFICFMEFSTPSFINQYDSRPNYLFVEYLEHYREIGATLLAEYPLQLLIAAFLVPLLTWAHYLVYRRITILERPMHWLAAILLVPVIMSSMLMGARSTLGHRPANPATVAVTNDHLVNELALSSAYTLMFAIYQSRYDRKGGKPYGKMPFEQVVDIIRDEMEVGADSFTSEQYPTWHKQQSVNPRKRPYNLVIILEESLGAEFVGKLGGLSLTPNIDRLADDGIWFENLYATGTRSVRGIEAVTTGFLPTPAISVVKQNKAQRDFFTLASYLKQFGYDTGFIYGGESHFDNMRGFFKGNGFNYVIDHKDYGNPIFKGSWGVSDEDLFNMADQKFRSYSLDQPFFSLIFSSSFHSPFEFPDGRIERNGNDEHDAVKYADYAVGQFINKARHSPYWENTIFIVIADHNSRVYGDALVPIERFHIPGLILGGPVQPDVITTQASQIDIAPTLLSLMGVSGEHPMIGRDLTRTEMRNAVGRSIMQFYKVSAYREKDQVVVLRYDLPPAIFDYRDNKLVPSDLQNEELVEKALAYSIFPQVAYDKKLYPQHAED
ncbi:MAG: LTA synthase family protein [bacterium]